MSNNNAVQLIWIEISKRALTQNIKTLRQLVGRDIIIAPAVKANAYGHGMIESAKIILRAGADWLCVNSLFEAQALRDAGIACPIYIFGYVLNKDLEQAVALDCRLVAYNKEMIKELAATCKRLHKKAKIHIKVETGNNRQGVAMDEILDFVAFIKKFPEIEIEGIATHFADMEDKMKSTYAEYQLKNFREVIGKLALNGVKIPIAHCANSAATILFPQTYFQMVRPGIAVYGMWPSEKVKKRANAGINFHSDFEMPLISQHELGSCGFPSECCQRKGGESERSEASSWGKRSFPQKMELRPVLSWKTKIAQIKKVPSGAFIGYGCTYKTQRPTKIAILPVGYYDGYDRGFSNKSHVLIHGKKAQVRGRVCMNMIMVDVTDIPKARVEDTAVLLGKDGAEEITAEFLADLTDTINYEITTKIRESIPRVVVA